MLPQPISLLDVTDVEAFVNHTLHRAGLDLSRDERDELLLEGVCIMYRLAAIYRPDPAHGRNESRFSGFAAQFLPRKLGDAWHRMHPEHRLITDPQTGKRHWEYGPPAVSYEQVVCSDSERPGARGGVPESRTRQLHEFVPVAHAARPGAHDDRAHDGRAARAA